MLPGRLRNPKFSAGSIRQYSGTARRSHRHLASSPTWVDGQSGAPFASPVPRSLISQPEICGSVPRYRFKISGASVPRYRLDWIVQSYSRRSHWHICPDGTPRDRCRRSEWGTVHPHAEWCPARSHSSHWFDIRRWAILGVATGTRRAFCLWSGRRQPPTPTPGSGRLRPLSPRHLASPSAADGQSGRTSSGKDRCVHSLASQFRNQCHGTASRFVGAVPSYQLDWIVVSYSSVATGAFWDTLLVVASGGHPS